MRSPRDAQPEGAPAPLVRVAPQGRSNSWEDVSDLSAALGMPLDEWQDMALEAAMGERADGRWLSKFVGISAPRQNGKSQLIVARALAGVLLFGEKMIIISAHETDTAREVWKRLVDVVEANPSVEERVTGRMDAINREFLAFGEGMDKQTIKIKARRASGSRGFSADCLLLDEAQRLDKAAWGSIVPTMSARSKVTQGGPQMWLFGTPPTTDDDPFAFSRVRDSAKAGAARHTWLEWAADPNDDINDPRTWAKANPSYGVRITREACEDDRAAMDDEQFAMERLGMWADETSSASALDVDRWGALAIATASPDWQAAAVGLDMDKSGRTWLAVAAHADEPMVHVELTSEDPLEGGIDRAVNLLWQTCKRRRPVVIPSDSGAAVLVPALKAREMKVYLLSPSEMAQASMGLTQAMKDGSISHLDDAVLAQAVRESSAMNMKGSQWRLGRDGEQGGAPIQAVACAHMGAVKWAKRVRAEKVGRSRERVTRVGAR